MPSSTVAEDVPLTLRVSIADISPERLEIRVSDTGTAYGATN